MDVQANDLINLDHLGSDAVSHAERSLELLRAIESTISALCYERRIFDTISEATHRASEAISRASPVKPLDPKGHLEEKFSRAQDAAKRLYEVLLEKRRSAQSDPHLTPEDGIVEEFTNSIAAVAEMHNALNALRWALGEHDAHLEKPSGKALKTAKELERYLDTL